MHLAHGHRLLQAEALNLLVCPLVKVVLDLGFDLLDRRLVSRRYGRAILETLPGFTREIAQ